MQRSVRCHFATQMSDAIALIGDGNFNDFIVRYKFILCNVDRGLELALHS